MTTQSLKTVILRRIIPSASGWATAAILEAATYLVLAGAIMKQQTPAMVLVCAAVAILSIVLASRSGFRAGAALADALYLLVGERLRLTKIKWFTSDKKALLNTIVCRNIPGFMSIPAHQLQVFVHGPLISIVLVIGVGFFFGIAIMLVLLGLLTAAFLMLSFSQKKLQHADARRNETNQQVNQSALELIGHLELLRTAGSYQSATSRITQSWAIQDNLLQKISHNAALSTFTAAISGCLPVAGILFYCFIYHISAEATLALLILSLRATAPMDSLALAVIGINDQRAGIAQLRLLDSSPTIDEPDYLGSKHPDSNILTIKGVQLNSYKQVISATINSGERWLISGDSGSGKTTLLNTIMRFEEPEQGKIILGNVPLSLIERGKLSEYFAYVPQNPSLFSGTIADNIRLGKPDAADDAIEHLARLVLLGDVIDRSPEGINQHVGKMGDALSGGEKQRIALARALIKDAPVLILDEATSALDEATEKHVAALVLEKSHTLIVVSHREPDIWQPTNMLNI